MWKDTEDTEDTKHVCKNDPEATVERCNQMDRGCICSPNFSDHGAILRENVS